MTVKDHYDKHLGSFYSWMLGSFDDRKNEFLKFCMSNDIKHHASGCAIDLGAGNGFQSAALAELGFSVKSIDFSSDLLMELAEQSAGYPVDVISDDIRNVGAYSVPAPELIICCGDTISHLDSPGEIEKLISDTYSILDHGGRLILSFRDYSSELSDTARFIPVKSDDERILTCFLEYFQDRVRVTDLLYEKTADGWIQRVSSYFKVRVSAEMIAGFMESAGFRIQLNSAINRMIHIIGGK